MKAKIEEVGLDSLDEILSMRMEVLGVVFKSEFETMSEEEKKNLLEENRNYYKRELPSGGHIACFAYIDNNLVGCGGLCLYNEMPSPDHINGKCGYLMNVYVRAQYRNHGLGTDITNWLINSAKKKGVNKIYLESSVIAKNMYYKIGFNDMKDYMIYKNKAP